MVLVLAVALAPVQTTAAEGSPLKNKEECAAIYVELLTEIMSGLSRDADEQMQRIAAEAYARGEEVKRELVTVCAGETPDVGLIPPDRQAELTKFVYCSYHDKLASEYARDGLDMPTKFAELCQR